MYPPSNSSQGDNVLAIRGGDDGIANFVDVKVTANVPSTVDKSSLYGEPVASDSLYPFTGFIEWRPAVPRASSAAALQRFPNRKPIPSQCSALPWREGRPTFLKNGRAEFRVTVGRTKRSGAGGITRKIVIQAEYPKFDKRTLVNDYEVWRVVGQPISTIAPVALPSAFEPATPWDVGSTTSVLGWGLIDPAVSKTAVTDQLRVINEQIAADRPTNPDVQFEMRPNATKPEGGSHGDSGGPILGHRSDGSYVQIGLYSGSFGSTPDSSDWRDLAASLRSRAVQAWIAKNTR